MTSGDTRGTGRREQERRGGYAEAGTLGKTIGRIALWTASPVGADVGTRGGSGGTGGHKWAHGKGGEDRQRGFVARSLVQLRAGP